MISQNSNILFKDQYDVPFAYLFNMDHYEVVKIASGKFKRYLGLLYHESQGRVASTDAINSAVTLLQGRAEYHGETIPLSLRAAWNNGDIIYDLTNEKWQYIRISKDGWRIINNTDGPIFCRFKQIPQAIPDRNYEPDIFDKFLQLTNLKEEKDRILLNVYIILLLIPDIPHIVSVFHGGQGSAKSTLQKLIKLLIDPAKPLLLTFYNNTREFIQQLAHNYIAFYDNLKKAPIWLSDEVCKAVTGVGSTKRELYSDDDDIIYEYKRCLGFSGINVSLTEPDALDRSVLIRLERIKPEDRKREEIILAEFFRIRPKLLGYIFDILAKAMKIRDTIELELDDLPRMADSALWGEAIARAMGYKPREYIEAYYDNIGKQNIEALENHPLGHLIAKYIEMNEICEGNPSEVLDMFETFAIQQNIKIDTKNKYWPKSANAFTRRINQLSSNLLEGFGIEIKITRDKANTSQIVISKIDTG